LNCLTSKDLKHYQCPNIQLLKLDVDAKTDNECAKKDSFYFLAEFEDHQLDDNKFKKSETQITRKELTIMDFKNNKSVFHKILFLKDWTKDRLREWLRKLQKKLQ
jgi:hypothetical protein